MKVDIDRNRRWRTTATTWFSKAVALLRASAEEEAATNEYVRATIGYDAAQLLHRVLWEGEMLVPLIDPAELGECERAAKAISAAIRRRRLAAKLGNVEGRTPEESALFAAKARELKA